MNIFKRKGRKMNALTGYVFGKELVKVSGMCIEDLSSAKYILIGRKLFFKINTLPKEARKYVPFCTDLQGKFPVTELLKKAGMAPSSFRQSNFYKNCELVEGLRLLDVGHIPATATVCQVDLKYDDLKDYDKIIKISSVTAIGIWN